MKIAIIVAMDKELQLLLPLLEDVETTNLGRNARCYKGHIGENEVYIAKCGIGKVNAAIGTAELLDKCAPELVINTGVAGGTGGAEVLDVVVATGVAYHDVWCGPGTEYGQADHCPRIMHCNQQALNLLKGGIDDVKFGTIASGDIFVDSPDTVEKVLRLYPDALGVDMESAAIAQTCLHFGVAFICIRVISDTPGKVSDNGAQYESFWQSAPERTFAILNQLLKQL